VRFVAGQLWVLDQWEHRVAAYRVPDPAAPLLVGTFQDHAAALMSGRWRGTRLFALEGFFLRLYQAQ
jgi:hypothetical protein